jgi:hypothetical protein
MAKPGPLMTAFFLMFIAASPLAAQQDDRITRLEQQLDELLRQAQALRQELDALKGAEAPVEDLTSVDVTTPTPETADATATANEQDTAPLADVQTVENNPSAAATAKALNPDISVIGTFLSHAGDNFEDRSPIALDEAEIALEAFIDPYAKGRFFIAITPEEVDVEEGYAHFLTLPWGLTAKAGKTKATFGKANTWHTHTRPWVDQPLVVTRFLGEEGLADVGVSVSKSIDNPFGAFIEVTGEVYSGDVEGSFGRGAHNDLLYNAHLKLFRDVTENSNVEVGTSWARGTLPEGEGHNRLAGVDLTYRWKPLSRAIYRSLIARVEALASERSDFDGTLYGYYGSLDYQLARRWYAGARIDRADSFVDDERFSDRGASATLTFLPSEFSKVRAQYRRTRLGVGPSFDEFFIQLQFAIGAHGAHVF